MNNKLTRERIEAAITEIDPRPVRPSTRYRYGQGIPSPESAQTILAALDAARWRDAETEPPEDLQWVIGVCNGVWFVGAYIEALEQFIVLGGDSIDIDEIDSWLPLPKWEDEA